ncbi:MAG: hypothetical protein N2045_13930 [Fimbriimonadales bacterium]|nr:hypothetical protein [Fimbriimonadales bacterium]
MRQRRFAQRQKDRIAALEQRVAELQQQLALERKKAAQLSAALQAIRQHWLISKLLWLIK